MMSEFKYIYRKPTVVFLAQQSDHLKTKGFSQAFFSKYSKFTSDKLKEEKLMDIFNHCKGFMKYEENCIILFCFQVQIYLNSNLK